jgi:hypothetical protein
MRIVLVAAVSIMLAALAGCGGAKTALGEVSQHDVAALSGVASEMKRFSSSYADLLTAMTDGDIPGSRSAVDAMSDELNAASDKLLSVDSDQQRGTLQRYVDTMRRLTAAADRVVAYDEDDTIADAGVQNDVVNGFQQAALDARRADESLMSDMLKHLNAEQRRKLRDAYQQANAEFKRAVGN